MRMTGVSGPTCQHTSLFLPSNAKFMAKDPGTRFVDSIQREYRLEAFLRNALAFLPMAEVAEGMMFIHGCMPTWDGMEAFYLNGSTIKRLRNSHRIQSIQIWRIPPLCFLKLPGMSMTLIWLEMLAWTISANPETLDSWAWALDPSWWVTPVAQGQGQQWY